jgi:hypothetical protein
MRAGPGSAADSTMATTTVHPLLKSTSLPNTLSAQRYRTAAENTMGHQLLELGTTQHHMWGTQLCLTMPQKSVSLG